MHTCGVEIKDGYCGAPAGKKFGLVWVCDPHWELFDMNDMDDWWTDDHGTRRLMNRVVDAP